MSNRRLRGAFAVRQVGTGLRGGMAEAQVPTGNEAGVAVVDNWELGTDPLSSEPSIARVDAMIVDFNFLAPEPDETARVGAWFLGHQRIG